MAGRRKFGHGNYATYIEVDPKIMLGKPVIKGTRITLELIIERLAARETIEQILKSHPRLPKESIYAVLQFATDSLKTKYLLPVAL
jgi:uncharacterized protein (DUF433 family)